MLNKTRKTIISLLVLLCCLMLTSFSGNTNKAKGVTLPSIFSNHMVLQRDSKISVWGNADASSGIVTVKFNIQEKSTKVNEEGKWMLQLDAVKAGGPFNLEVIASDTVVYKDVLVGDVWICSGQSNMEMSVGQSKNSFEEIKNANYNNIRLITIPKKVSGEPLNNFTCSWSVCNPDEIEPFSAVGYYFGKELNKELNIPIGLIHSSWGGTPIEAWMKYETLENDSMSSPIVQRFEADLKNYPERIKKYNETIKKLRSRKTRRPMFQTDIGNDGLSKGYAKKEFNDVDWQEMYLPQFWENNDDMVIDGAVWFRKTIKIPKEFVNKNLWLELGAIDDFDTTYLNGEKVGTTDINVPNFWTHLRKYKINKNLIKDNKVTIAVRVFDHYGSGGFGGPRRNMKIYSEDDLLNTFDISGKWKYQIEKSLDPFAVTGPNIKGMPPTPIGPNHSHRPSGLFNAMIYPIRNFSIKGVIWYQGEANAGRAYQYRTLLPNMMKDWRMLFSNSKLFFGIVSLANFMKESDEPIESDWAELREAQAITVANDKNSSLALAIDIGNARDIHPKNKQEVGRRLALGALAKVYGNDIVYSGPVYKSHKIDGDKIIVTFSHIGSGLKIKGNEELKGFSIASVNKRFVWAKAKIKNNKVIVWSNEISNPISVRYAWGNNPKCNLYNEEGLPTVPFRIDQWNGITFNIK